MSKKHKDRIKTLAEIDPEKDMPLPDRLKVAEEVVEAAEKSPEPEIKASETKHGAEVVEPVPWSTKIERYRR